ncbi:hypothetical protein Tco_0895283 [Tanacetum coccineum]|uniref:Uncharacterized protein n=1 Tax=Tanacetum coccineum TaxID=301880 RepID=A0ABQ5CE74_9ASTR
METKLTKDEEGESVDNTKYRGMIGSLLYLTASRPDIMFSVCLCARFQEDPKTSHLEAVKRIFRYIKGTTHLGLWYPKGSGIETIVYADSDHAGDYENAGSTSVGFANVYGFRRSKPLLPSLTNRLDDIPIMCDNKGAIDLSKNPVQHSRTKHIEIRHHFLRDNIQKGNISIEKPHSYGFPIGSNRLWPWKARIGVAMAQFMMGKDEELLEFTSEYYIPFALHPAVPLRARQKYPISRLTAAYWQLIPRSICSAPSIIPLGQTDGIRFPSASSRAFAVHTEKIRCAEARRGCSSGGESEPKKLTLAETQKGAPHDYVEARQEGALCQSSGSTNLLRRYPRLLPSIRYGYCAASRAGGAAESKVEVESSRSYAQKLAEEKMALLVKAEQERADTAEYKASCHWAVKYLEGGVRIIILLGWMIFARDIRRQLEKQEEKLLKTQYRVRRGAVNPTSCPRLLSARWLIRPWFCALLPRASWNRRRSVHSFGIVVKWSLARGKAEAVEELHEKKLLTVPAAQVPGYNQNAYEELVAAMEAMKLLELPHIAQLERDQDYPIDVIMAGLTLARHATEGAEAQPNYFLKPDVAQLQVPIFASPRDILNPFALEKEIPLKESLEAHAIRLAKKKGVKGKAILCGVGAAHLPRSDGVPV